jgi:hypothetical protein
MSDQPAPPLPTIHRREHAPVKVWWGLAAAGNAALWAVALAFGAPPLALAGLGLGSLLSCAALWRKCRRRRVALRVDVVGVHELFADGREESVRWEEIRDVFFQRDHWEIYADRVVKLSHRVEEARALGSLIRARWRGQPLAPPADFPNPTAEEIAAVFGVPVEQVPLQLREKTRRQWLVIAVFSVILGLIAVLDLFRREAEVSVACAVYWVLLVLPRLLALHFQTTIEVSPEGLTRIQGRKRRFWAWSEIDLEESGTIKGWDADLYLPDVLKDRETLLYFVRRLWDRRGQFPQATLLPEHLPSDRALSRARPPSEPTASDRALSRAAPVEEVKERLGAAAEEEMALEEQTVSRLRDG